MDNRVYVLLEIKEGDSRQAARVLRGKPGVVIADLLEGPPDVIMVIEASDWRKLAGLTGQALAAVESMTENFLLLRAEPGP